MNETTMTFGVVLIVLLVVAYAIIQALAPVIAHAFTLTV